MKLLFNAFFALFCLTATLPAAAQQASNTQPRLFNSFPSSIQCTVQELSRVFALAEGQNITLSFSGNFQFSGPVTSNIQKFSNLQSTIIKSPAFNNAVFSLSKRIEADNSVTYVGMILNEDYADAYMLKKSSNGTYSLEKFEVLTKRQDCNQ